MIDSFRGLPARAGVALLVLVALLGAGCGAGGGAGGGGVSGGTALADPAAVAPANPLAFAELTVRPGGGAASDPALALDKLTGHSPGSLLRPLEQRLLARHGLSYQADLAPWLGRRIGVVVTAPSAAGIAFILTASDASAGVAALRKKAHHDGMRLSSSTYRGVTLQTSDRGAASFGEVGGFVLDGGAPALRAVIDAAKGGPHLAGGAIPAASPATVARGFANVQAILGALAAVPTLPGTVRGQLSRALARTGPDARLTVALTATGSAITLDVAGAGLPAATATSRRGPSYGPSDVGGLPAAAWLAIAIGGHGFNPASITSAVQGNLARAGGPAGQATAVLGTVDRVLGFSLLHDLLPSLGPFHLAVAGPSVFSLAAGLQLHPGDPAAASRLLAGIYRLVARKPALGVKGTPRAFTFTTSGALARQVSISQGAAGVLATFNEPSAAAFLSPGQTLAGGNRVFTRAKAALPAGAEIPLFLDFGPLATLAGVVSSPSAQKAITVLRRLDYFVLGIAHHPTHVRLVLGLR